MSTEFDATPVLKGLKDFQSRTVEHVFQRMFLDASPARRFLVADEVGLGKTWWLAALLRKPLNICSSKRIAGSISSMSAQALKLPIRIFLGLMSLVKGNLPVPPV